MNGGLSCFNFKHLRWTTWNASSLCFVTWNFQLLSTGASCTRGANWQCKYWIIRGNHQKTIKNKNLFIISFNQFGRGSLYGSRSWFLYYLPGIVRATLWIWYGDIFLIMLNFLECSIVLLPGILHIEWNVIFSLSCNGWQSFWSFGTLQDDYKSKEKIATLDCGHEYHSDCLKKWLRLKNVCPICKSEALNTERMDV